MSNTIQPLPVYNTPPQSVKEMRDRVIDLIDKGWIQGNLAVDIRNELIDEESSNACGVCLFGAILRARVTINNVISVEYCNLLDKKLELMGYHSKVGFNDKPGQTKENVLNMLKEIEV